MNVSRPTTSVNGSELEDEEPSADTPVSTDVPKGRRSFAGARRELTDEEMANTGVVKILLDDTERLEGECAVLRDYVEKFHLSDKRSAILHEKLKPQTAIDLFSGAALAVGSAMVGFAPGAWKQQPTAWMALLLGCVLIIAGIIAKRVSK